MIKQGIYLEDFEEVYKKNIDWSLLEGKCILITGATGMLASYLVYYLCFLREYKNIEIRIVAQGRSEEKAYKKFSELWRKDYFEFRNDNIVMPLVDFPKCDYIIHAASLANPCFYATIPIEVAEPNAIGTYNLLNYANENNCISFLYFSSGDVYGFVDDVENITENDMGKVNPLDIHSCYSESKRMGETWCKLFAEERGINTIIARIGHTYGPTMNIEDDPRVFSSFMKALIQKENIIMYSDGMAKRPFCYLSDAIQAFFILLFKGKKGEAYNVCNSRQFFSMNELAEVILGLKPEDNLQIIYKNRNLQDNYVENRDNKANKPVEWKLEKLGWEPEVTIEKGFKRVLKYMTEERREI